MPGGARARRRARRRHADRRRGGRRVPRGRAPPRTPTAACSAAPTRTASDRHRRRRAPPSRWTSRRPDDHGCRVVATSWLVGAADGWHVPRAATGRRSPRQRRRRAAGRRRPTSGCRAARSCTGPGASPAAGAWSPSSSSRTGPATPWRVAVVVEAPLGQVARFDGRATVAVDADVAARRRPGPVARVAAGDVDEVRSTTTAGAAPTPAGATSGAAVGLGVPARPHGAAPAGAARSAGAARRPERALDVAPRPRRGRRGWRTHLDAGATVVAARPGVSRAPSSPLGRSLLLGDDGARGPVDDRDRRPRPRPVGPRRRRRRRHRAARRAPAPRRGRRRPPRPRRPGGVGRQGSGRRAGLSPNRSATRRPAGHRWRRRRRRAVAAGGAWPPPSSTPPTLLDRRPASPTPPSCAGSGVGGGAPGGRPRPRAELVPAAVGGRRRRRSCRPPPASSSPRRRFLVDDTEPRCPPPARPATRTSWLGQDLEVHRLPTAPGSLSYRRPLARRPAGDPVGAAAAVVRPGGRPSLTVPGLDPHLVRRAPGRRGAARPGRAGRRAPEGGRPAPDAGTPVDEVARGRCQLLVMSERPGRPAGDRRRAVGSLRELADRLGIDPDVADRAGADGTLGLVVVEHLALSETPGVHAGGGGGPLRAGRRTPGGSGGPWASRTRILTNRPSRRPTSRCSSSSTPSSGWS